MPPRTRQADPKPADDSKPEADAPEASPAVGPEADAVLAEALARIAELQAQLDARYPQAEDEAPESDVDDSPGDMCAEHFPQGFFSDIVKWIEERTGRQTEVSCEHGTYRRAQA